VGEWKVLGKRVGDQCRCRKVAALKCRSTQLEQVTFGIYPEQPRKRPSQNPKLGSNLAQTWFKLHFRRIYMLQTTDLLILTAAPVISFGAFR
jgi:hypothetical protein